MVITFNWFCAVLDSAGKVEPGVLIGNLWSMGSYRECMSISATVASENSSKLDFTGKYCHLSIQEQGVSKSSLYVRNNLFKRKVPIY